MPSRRHALFLTAAAAAGGLLPACRASRSVSDTVPGQARLLIRADGSEVTEISGRYEGRDFSLDSPFRVASISKVLVGELARRLHAAGALDMDAEVGDVIGFPLRHPEFPDTPVTLRQLIAHRSGIIDPDVYWLAGSTDIRTILTPAIWEVDVQPGAGFRYSNLNYGIAATVMEAATGTRFDHLFTQTVAKPLGLDIGFNWSGVSAAKRASGFPCLRGVPGAWDVQIDGTETLLDNRPAVLRDTGWTLDDYVPGTNGTLFSPQGGLRASLRDLAIIGRDVLLTQPDLWQPEWQMSDTDGRGAEAEAVEGRGSEGSHFIAFGEGVYIYPDGPLAGYESPPWVGHHGEAYGVFAGLWVVPETGDIIVHADLGSAPEGPPMTGGSPNQTVIAQSALQWAISNGAAE